jgi:hypothetical protein
MRRAFALAALLLPLGGCYQEAPGPAGYAQPGYPPGGYGYAQPGYPPPGYPPQGYAAPGSYDPSGGIYPGYSDNGGSPTLFVDGAVMPLIFFGGSWGYYDAHREFHRAPDAVGRHLDQQREAGGFHPGGGGFRPPEGRPPEGRPAAGRPPEGRAPEGRTPEGRPPEGRPSGGRPPQAEPNRAPSSFHPGEPPHQGAMPAAAPHPSAPPRTEPAHERGGHDCPPGQRC